MFKLFLHVSTIIRKFLNVFIYHLQIIIKRLLILFYILFHNAFQNYTSSIFKWLKLNEFEKK